MTIFDKTKHTKVTQHNCLECGSDLESCGDSILKIFRCTNIQCEQLWKEHNGRLEKVEIDENSILEESEKEMKRMYKQNKKKFHLDFIPDWLCNEIDCITDEVKFCPTVGCPIRKLKNELLGLKISSINDNINPEDVMAIKNNIKLKWDYIALSSPNINSQNIKFKIVYFESDEDKNKKTVIHEPFPRNRFDTDYDAYNFLDNFCKQTDENPENYYVSKVLVDKSKKKVKDRKSEMRYFGRQEIQTTLDEEIRDSGIMAEEQAVEKVLLLDYKDEDLDKNLEKYHNMKDKLINNHVLNEAMNEASLEELEDC